MGVFERYLSVWVALSIAGDKAFHNGCLGCAVLQVHFCGAYTAC